MRTISQDPPRRIWAGVSWAVRRRRVYKSFIRTNWTYPVVANLPGLPSLTGEGWPQARQAYGLDRPWRCTCEG